MASWHAYILLPWNIVETIPTVEIERTYDNWYAALIFSECSRGILLMVLKKRKYVLSNIAEKCIRKDRAVITYELQNMILISFRFINQ